MKNRLLGWLACPVCRCELELTEIVRERNEIWEGALDCTRCGMRYPITRGVPRLVPAGLSGYAKATAERFGYEWTRFAEIRPEYQSQFLGWVAPLAPDDFAGRVVLDAGCGKGRHLRLAATFGAREVIGIDLGSGVEAAAKNTRDIDTVHIIQGDLTCPPLRQGAFDVVYSVGVLHHLADPAAGCRSLASLLAPHGRIVSWVYAREGNHWVRAVVDPIRLVTSRLPLWIVKALSWGLTLPLWIVIQLLYGPSASREWLGRLLPYRSYLVDLVRFPYRELHCIVFDQLLAPLVHYMSRADMEGCFAEAGLELQSLRWHHNNSWAAWGVRRSEELSSMPYAHVTRNTRQRAADACSARIHPVLDEPARKNN